MGSLERVQYKFASIIGELCSEPMVLSQFAVWLDLKLAEYKAKGSISLDCSGEKPEPSWMKGVIITSPPSSLFEDKSGSGDVTESRSPFKNSSQTFSKQRLTPTSERISQHSVSSPSPTYNTRDRVSPDDVVVIKDEVTESPSCVYQTGLYVNEARLQGTGNFGDSRKRLSMDDSSEFIPQQHFSSKVRRTATASTSGSPSSVSSNSNTGLLRDTPHDLICSTEEVHPSTSSNITDSISQSSWLGLVTSERETDASVPRFRAQNAMNGPSCQTTPVKPNSTRRNINAAVRNFERWLRLHPSKDQRKIQNIEAEALDEYLAEYFKEIKKPSGQDYNPFSLCVYRSSLEKYLKEHNYPHSIHFSQRFTKSQNAFKQRKMELEVIGTSKTHTENEIVNLVTTPGQTRNRPGCSILQRGSLGNSVAPSSGGRKLNSTKRNMIAVVRNFERWLWFEKGGDRRKILDIPPAQLDIYLADFFANIKKPGGKEYNPLSLQVYRTSLERYLKENGYGTSILSQEFTQSQRAFRKKKLQLEEASARTASENISSNVE